jgi:uncharacterized protein YjbI with pentapeptide repeats
VLSRVNGERKGRVVQFLYEAGLIRKDCRILDLRECDLSGAMLRKANLENANLEEANLTRASLVQASLTRADLDGASLGEADLYSAYLDHANLNEALLSSANLSEAHGWIDDQLRAAWSLEGTTMPDGRTLRGDTNPDGPTFEDWLKSKDREEDA